MKGSRNLPVMTIMSVAINWCLVMAVNKLSLELEGKVIWNITHPPHHTSVDEQYKTPSNLTYLSISTQTPCQLPNPQHPSHLQTHSQQRQNHFRVGNFWYCSRLHISIHPTKQLTESATQSQINNNLIYLIRRKRVEAQIESSIPSQLSK